MSTRNDPDFELIRRARQQVEGAASRTRLSLTRASTAAAREPHGPPAGLSIPGYTMGEEIHRGGQGVVYRAVQAATGRTVAVKVQHGGAQLGAIERARFEREVRILAHLRHPNIVAVHDVGECLGWTYHVMDFVDGVPLDRFVERARLEPPQIMRLMERVALAVNAAHQRGVIHRDLKPGNVLVDAAGEPRVLDFGLAKSPDFGETVTATGQFIGSLPWASPEQVSGEPALMDVRSDVYSLGVVTYRLLTGGFPYEVTGSVQRVMQNIQHADPAPPGVGEEIDTIVLKCLRKEPARRYQSAGELAGDIRRYLGGEPIDAKRESRWYVVRKQISRHRAAFAFAAILALTLFASSVAAWVLYLRAEHEAEKSAIAEHVSRVRLRDSMVSEARALRSTSSPGRRVRSLSLLAEAARRDESEEPLAPADLRRIRDEAVAALALCDLTEEYRAPLDRAVIAQTFSADGARRAAGHTDGTVRVTLFPHGAVTVLPAPSPGAATPEPGELDVYQLRFSPGGRYLVARYGGSPRRRLILWDLYASPPRAVFERAGSTLADGYDFGPADEWIAVGVPRGIEIIGLPTGERLRTLPLPANPWVVACDATRGHVAATPGRQIYLYETRQGRLLRTVETGPSILSMAFSPDGAVTAVGYDDARIVFLDADTWTERATMLGHQGAITGVQFSPDSRRLVSWSWDGTTRLWDVAAREQLMAPLAGYCAIRVGDGDMGRVLAIHVSSSLWRFDDPGEYRRLNYPGRYPSTSWMNVAPDSNVVAVESGEGAGVSFLRVHDGAPVRSVDGVSWATWTRDRRFIGVTAQGLAAWDAPEPDDATTGRLLYASERIRHFCLLPGDRRAVVHDARDRIVLVDLETGAEVAELSPSLPTCSSLRASADGRWVCADVWRGPALHVWDIERRAVAAAIEQPPVGHTRSWFSPDGRSLVVSRGPSFEWYDTTDWKLRRSIDRDDPLERVGGLVAFAPDGSVAALSMSRSRIQLFDGAAMEPLTVFHSPDASYIVRLLVSADSRWLVGCDAQGVVHRWDLRTIRARLNEVGLGWDK